MRIDVIQQIWKRSEQWLIKARAVEKAFKDVFNRALDLLAELKWGLSLLGFCYGSCSPAALTRLLGD